MPKKGVRQEVNAFIQGIITEASPLNFPPNASRDEQNYEINVDGTRDRRLGMDFESNYEYIPTAESSESFKTSFVNTFKWFTVGGDTQKEFLVAQVNKTLYFYDVKQPTVSRQGFLGTVVIDSFLSNRRFSFTSLEGRLVVVSGNAQIAVIEYDPVAISFTLTYQRIRTRDVWGVETSSGDYETDDSYRAATIDDPQYYNLTNQSWGLPRKTKTGTLTNPLEIYKSALSVYPSNSEAVWSGLQYQPVESGADPFERIYPNLYTEVFGAKIQSAKGFYIIDALRRGFSRMEEYANNGTKHPEMGLSTITLPEDTSQLGASCVTEFAGRVWYAGFGGAVVDGDRRSPILTNYVFFSQLVKSPADITNCYQAGDPTSRDNADLLDTDGGFIRVSGANKIVALRNLDANLIVIATNGVWYVTGGSEYGFSATNYKVSKISSFGGLAESSVITAGGRLYFWAEDGIYTVGASQLGDLSVESLTQNTIQSLYGLIPIDAKYDTIATYDMYNKTIRWMWKAGNIFTSVSDTKELIFDTRVGSFSVSKIYNEPTANIEIIGGFTSYSNVLGSLPEPVFVGLEPVYVDDEPVEAFPTSRISGVSQIKYLVLVKDPVTETLSMTFANYGNRSFRDWFTYDGVGVDAFAFALTGFVTAGDSAVDKQIPYIVMHFRRTETGSTADFVPENQSSCIIRTQWDWATTIQSNKWSQPQQAYRYRKPRFVISENDNYDNGFETITSKTKLRGKGRSFSLYMSTEPDKDCRIIGWNVTVNGDAVT